MPSTEWIAHRLALLCADGRGRVHGGRILLDRAARVALLVDLAFRGRVSAGEDGTELDTTPTGFPPADVLLEFIDTYPDRTMSHALDKAPVGLLDVADPAGASSRPARRRGIALPAELIAAQRARLPQDEDEPPDSPETAALLAILAGVGLAPERAGLLADCGTAAWLVGDCVTYLGALRVRFAQANADASAWQAANFMY